jgi:hypothetical protein
VLAQLQLRCTAAHGQVFSKRVYCGQNNANQPCRNLMLCLTLQELIEYRNKYLGPNPPPIMALGLSSRKNLCIHPQVAGERSDTARSSLPVRLLAHISSYSWLLLSYVAVCFCVCQRASGMRIEFLIPCLYHMTYIDPCVLQRRVRVRVWTRAAAV